MRNIFLPKFIDGSEVPQEYLDQVTKMIADAVEAEERIGIDELEEYARSVKEEQS